MKELKHEIIVEGSPKISNLPKNEAKIFYSTLLNNILEKVKEKDEELNKDKGK